MVDTATALVISRPDPTTRPAPPTSWIGDLSSMMVWSSGFGMMTSSSRIGMLLSYLSEDEASTCSLSKATNHPLEK